jgi:hypothetical protein
VNNRPVLYGLAFTVFLVLRVATLVTSLETVSWDEELHRGTIARELIAGLKAPLWDYQADSYSGGSLVVGLLAAPLFFALGPRLIVLKLVPLALSLVTLGLFIALLDRYHSRRAAWVGACLFILAPPVPTQLSFLAMGYHTESIVFSVLLVLGWARALERPDGRAPFWLGLIAGLAFSFTYITAITTLGCLLCSGPRLRRGGAAAKLAAGLALGLVPWAAYNLTHHFDGVRAAQLWFTPPEGAVSSPAAFTLRIGRRFAGLLAMGIPLSYGFPAMLGVPGPLWSYAYFGLTLAPILWLLFRVGVRPPVVRPFLACALVFLVVYPFTIFGVPRGGAAEEFRHFVPLQFVALASLAIALTEASFGRAATVALVALGTMGQATLPGRDPAPHLVDYRGYSYFVFGSVWNDRIDPVAPQASPFLAGLDERTARFVYWGAIDASPATMWAAPITSPQPVREVPVGYRPYFAEAVGYATGLRQPDFRPLVAAIDAVPFDAREHFTLGYSRQVDVELDTLLHDVTSVRELPKALRRWCHFGLGGLVLHTCMVSDDHARCRAGMAALEATDPEASPPLYRGAGNAAAVHWLAGAIVDIARIGPHAIPPARRADFAWGLGWGVRRVFKEDLVRTRDRLARLEPGERAAALAGVSAYDAFYRLEAEPAQHAR